MLERVFVGTPIGLLQALGMAISFGSAAYLATGGSLGGAELRLAVRRRAADGCQTTWGGYTILTKPLLASRQPLSRLTVGQPDRDAVRCGR